ncbi:MAG: fumarylacetoacetate hydrolase family protein [Proteobacteria bacterium]|nr:fumarylacetoacetate hydrolase family protein [Pseudomonadota bacterium]
MNYKHTYRDGKPCQYSQGKVVCVARNYYEHIKELNNPVPTEPIFFIKPATALRALTEEIVLPEHGRDCHHETELAVLIGTELSKADKAEAERAVAGYAIALDLTLRDVQQKLKEKGYPWEIAKGFDGSCPISPFLAPNELDDPQDTLLKLSVNGTVRQEGSTKLMINKTLDLIVNASTYFTLMPGDILLTGTPAGVAKLESGDRLELELAGQFKFQTAVR